MSGWIVAAALYVIGTVLALAYCYEIGAKWKSWRGGVAIASWPVPVVLALFMALFFHDEQVNPHA